MKVLVAFGTLALSAVALFPATAQPPQQCSRNADDIKAAVVIQNASGEFCDGGAQVSGDASPLVNGNQAKVSTKLSANEFQALRSKVVKDQLFYCADQGVPANFCRAATESYVDRALLLYYLKCERQKIDIARCDSELVEAVAFQWY